jgi:hypothetical protein
MRWTAPPACPRPQRRSAGRGASRPSAGEVSFRCAGLVVGVAGCVGAGVGGVRTQRPRENGQL